MGFFFPESDHVYGLPQRKYGFKLPTTEETGPYRLFNQDLFPHASNSTVNLYGSIPYLMSHSEEYSAAVVYVNAADSWVHVLDESISSKTHALHKTDDDIDPRDGLAGESAVVSGEGSTKGTFANFVSESGTLEFFTFATTGSPKKLSKLLADISGYAPLPPIFSLGFHFSKWDATSARILMGRNEMFNSNQYQVDVLW